MHYIEYVSVKSNILDGLIVVISMIELIFLDTTSLTAFRSIRIFRMFRVLRVVRLLRSLKFMEIIIDILMEKFTSFIYLFLITFIFLLMYALIGSQLYAGKINPDLGFKENFDNFYYSFLSVFQLLTLINTLDLQVIMLNTEVYRGLTMLFFMSVTIIGNYVFLNLFIGILINGFLSKLGAEEEEENELETEKTKQNEANNLQLLSIKEIYDEEELLNKLISKKKQQKDYFEGIECEESLFLFSKKFILRRILNRIVISNKFETLILITIMVSSVKLALDTYDTLGDSSQLIDLLLNIIFVSEAAFKIIAFGFFFDKGSYLRNSWNILDFFIVIISIIDMTSTDFNLSFQKVSFFH